MPNVLVLGAGGQIARWAVPMLAQADVELTLLARNSGDLVDVPSGARVVEGDVLDRERLDEAVRGQDLVYANLSGDLGEQAENIVAAMTAAGVQRLVFVTALGIYDEVPGAFGEWNRSMIGPALGPYRQAADTIEDSGLDYTILRPAWLTDVDEISYEVTRKDEPFGGTEVSRKSVASLIVELIAHPELWPRSNLGVHKPGTDGDKPSFL
ncbi:NAD-dependent dehydratase [Nocardiopsis kunsanensis]|uniref:NAD-dependent dehydratase n=1 Tax=Nocardiopsis kunsanensis TaxID=141693 RepID=A0A918XFL1_9ACTN|nr:SDR family oxidoreductase [Nocardiopsis kunsanensis]GHD29797.1 NAD-dependent dehydratase [Nocardiopsis kunsanensis]